MSNAAILNPKASPAASTNYSVNIFETGTGCSRNGQIPVNITPKPAPKVVSSTTTICSGSDIYMRVVDTASYAGGYPVGTTVDWGA